MKHTTRFLTLALTVMGLFGAVGSQSSPVNREWERGRAEGVEFLILGNARILNGPLHTRLIGVFVEPEAFTMENLRAIFLNLSHRYTREDSLVIAAISDVTQRLELARQVDDTKFGFFWYRTTEETFLSACYIRAHRLEQFVYVSATGQLESIELRHVQFCEPSGDVTLDLVIGSHLGCTDFVRQLLDGGADPNFKSKYGGAPLVEAAYWGADETVELLLDRGADVNQTSSAGWTPLLSAVSREYSTIVELLLSRGADVNLRSEAGYTALRSAVIHRNINLIKKLLDHGADVTLMDADGKTAIETAEELGYEEGIRLLSSQQTQFRVQSLGSGFRIQSSD
jgi:hypothetical protein